MRQKSELIFTAIKIPLDFIMLTLAGVAAYWVRVEETISAIRPVIFKINFEQILLSSIIVSAISIIFFILAGLYSFRKIKITDEIIRIILACSTAMSAVIVYMFFVRELFDSRFIVLGGWLLSILFVVIERGILRKIQQITYRRGVGAHKIVIIGNSGNRDAKNLIATLKNSPELGFRILKVYEAPGPETLADLSKIHKKYLLDEIVQADSTISRKDSLELINFAEEHNIIFKYAAGTFEARTTNIDVHMIAGVPIIEIKRTRLDGWGKIIKRLIDLFFSSILLLLLSPLFLLIALLVKIESRGPVIYKNERVSKKGIFNVYKFRSMYSEYCIGPQFTRYTDQKKVLAYEQELIKKQSERQGPVYKVLNDPRRTKIGRFLEHYSLDELPQLFNVFIGKMSLVGPRPHQPREVAKYETHQHHVLDIKPGLTGFAQISGRSDLDFEEEVKLDSYYIENWSLRLDFWILLKTPWVVITRK